MIKFPKTVAFIGAGAVANALAQRFSLANFEIAAVASKSVSSAKTLAEKLHAKHFGLIENLANVISQIDLIFITTPDDQIKNVWGKLTAANLLVPGQHVAHCSGLHSANIFENAENNGIVTFSFHPLLPVPPEFEPYQQPEAIIVAIEGNEIGQKIGVHLAEQIRATYFILETKSKPLYHAAAVLTSNYLLSLASIGIDIFQQIGLKSNDSENFVLELLQNSVNNIRRDGLKKGLTGPIKRGDRQTVESHLSLLSDFNKDYCDIYRLLGKILLTIVPHQKTIFTDLFDGK